MATSPYSAVLRSQPGMVKRPGTSWTPPAHVMPNLPTVPGLDDARAPGATSRALIGNQLGNLPGRYNPILEQARAEAQYRLSGYGGVKFGTDNPSTPQREDLGISFDPNAPLGEREKQSVNAEQEAANSRGLLSSSFADKAVGAALVRMSEEKREIVNQFSSQINSALSQQAAETSSLISDWTRLYGEDSRWLVENPPPTPVPQNTGDAGGGRSQQAKTVTYADFLKGRKSTRALARQWDSTHNQSRRFG